MRTILREEILRINCPGFGEPSLLALGKARSLETYKVIIVNPVSILHLFEGGSEALRRIEAAQGDGLTSYTLANQDLLNKINDEVTARTEQLVKFLETGGLLIYFLCRPFALHGPTLSIDNYLWLLSLAPDQSSEKNSRNMSAVSQGRNIECTPEASDSEFFEFLQLPGLEWTTIIRTDNLTEGYTTLATAGPKKCISGELYAGDNAGRIVFLPAPYSPDFDRTLIECANLWYQRKLGNDVTIGEIKQAVRDATATKSVVNTPRVHISEVEAAKAQLIAKEQSQMNDSPLERSTAGRPASKSRQSMKSAEQEPDLPSESLSGGSITPSGPLSQVVTGANIVLKPGQTGGPNGLGKGDSGSSTTGTNPGVTADKGRSQNPRSASPNKAKASQNKILAANELTERKEPLAEDLEALRTLAPAPKPTNKQVITADIAGDKIPDTSAPGEFSGPGGRLPATISAEILLKELEQFNQEGGPPPSARPEDRTQPGRTLSAALEEVSNLSSRSDSLPQPQRDIDVSLRAGNSNVPPSALINALNQEMPKTPPLTWANSYNPAGVEALKEERESLYQQVKELTERLAVIDERLKVTDELKNILLTGEGLQLINACKKALSLIGWNVQPSTLSESELWLNDGDKTEVLARVVRSDGQGKRADLASLAESVITFWEEFDQEPKGLLISCTWASTPPKERNEPDYPRAGVEFAQKKNLCLLTTCQLLGIFREIDSGKQIGDEIKSSLVSTNGTFEGFDLSSVITPQNS